MGEEQVIIALRMAQAWQEAVQEKHPCETGVDTESQWISWLVKRQGQKSYKEPTSVIKREPSSFGKPARQVCMNGVPWEAIRDDAEKGRSQKRKV